MTSTQHPKENNWKELAAQKEKEWKEVTETRIQTLEAACEEKDRQLQEEKSKFFKLKEDFKYNLKLLEERDQELERYDATFADIRTQLNTKTSEISDLKIQLDDSKIAVNREMHAREELQMHYQHRLKEKQTDIDSYRSKKDAEFHEERKEFENFKRSLQRQLKEVEDELDTQKRELTMSFEDALKRREHEFRLQKDEMNAKVLEYELKAKLLAKELEIMKTSQQKNSEEFSSVEQGYRQLEKKVKEKEWELADLTAMKDAKISDLQNQISHMESTVVKMKEDFQRKYSEMDRSGRDKEETLAKIKEGYTEREQSLQNTVRELQSKLEDCQVQIRQLQWAKSDLEKEKDIQIEKMQEEINQQKEKWDRQIIDVSRSQVNKDLELQSLRDNEDKLKAEILQKKQDIERYKKDLQDALDRENVLERSKAQLDLDWQRRFEDIERQQYGKSEDLVKKISRSRDEAVALIKEKDRDIYQRDSLIRALHRDREQALQTLRKNKISIDKNIHVNPDLVWTFADPEELSDLREQNENLRAVIKEMRNQMEHLGQELPPPEDKSLEPQSSAAKEYVDNLEYEIRKLRQRMRSMEDDAEGFRKYGRAPLVKQTTNEEEVMSEVKDNSAVKRHIESLNEQIGALRSEKVELSAQVKKQQAKIQYLETTVDRLNKEPRQKQVEIDQLRYELNAQKRRDQAEIATLNQKVTDLEVQLVEARKEADEYYKANLERNMEVTTLGQQISVLKMELAEKRPELNFGAQELVIQQLQDEIMSLRQGGLPSASLSKPQDTNSTVRELQQKLKTAARHIAQLAKERQQLIEMGNRLRADMKKAGMKPTSVPTGGKGPLPTPRQAWESTEVSQPLSQQFLGKLSQLEKLQYQLTKQQLEYAQKFQEKEKSSSEAEREEQIQSILKKPKASSGMDVSNSVEIMEDSLRSTSPLRASREGVLSGMTPRDREQLLISMSSAGGESLEEIWRMLDRPSPSPFTTPRAKKSADFGKASSEDDLNNSSEEMVIQGQKPKVHERQKSETKVSTNRPLKLQKKEKLKIRNYNVKNNGLR
ncbi:hypothetical protein FSP39_012356 [Pinctada imbricata]|uniref:Coiled-coil domain-containing protein 57 n=1 Tax=Pinctada imbricata TaxID=66713 RepID=A0AA89BTQ2_PINIB|nr:hypothetical protein FSP39_012356 [Pinctada imbricata]